MYALQVFWADLALHAFRHTTTTTGLTLIRVFGDRILVLLVMIDKLPGLYAWLEELSSELVV
jgi:hypothetical protein